jgi:FlaA1/EpsC-like NDP-sugar epimerase
MGLFDGLWRYAGVPELEKLVAATTVSSALVYLTEQLLWGRTSPRSIFAGEWLSAIVLAGGARLALRVWTDKIRGQPRGLPTLVVGAGDAGESLLRDVQRMREGARWHVVGFVDDDPAKHQGTIRGVKVLGPPDETTLTREVRARGIKLVVLAMPTAPGPRIRDLLQTCTALGVKVQTVPALGDRMSVNWNAGVREIHIDDLLRREPVNLDVEEIEGLARDRVVLVSGAGGSIGSELCRQVLRFGPRLLLLVDHDENALFQINRELKAKFPGTEVEPLLADVTDTGRVERIFSRYRPSVVLHAAAHKHVVMMEVNPCEAVKNNVFGTITLAEAAHAHRTDAFVLISTDKAVRPSSVMGTTKRVTEMVIQRFAESSTTRFVAVRFGNVLGSAGSVVPIFREQIANGGPVTVTHPDVCRYFMTIPEAAQLVLQAAALGKTGEILMLDMGTPVKIVDLARDLIELSGLRPGEDIEIVFTGLQQGEKLNEELLLEAESYDATSHPKIVVSRINKVGSTFDAGLDRLRSAAFCEDPEAVRLALQTLVPEATLADEWRVPRILDNKSSTRSAILSSEVVPVLAATGDSRPSRAT